MESKFISHDIIGNVPITLTSDVFDGETLDTEVRVSNGVLCWIEGGKRDKFMDDFKELISKYRI